MNYIAMVEVEGDYPFMGMEYSNRNTYLFDPPIETDSDDLETMTALIEYKMREALLQPIPLQ